MLKGKVLYLTLKKKWFDMILSGEKKEEYREIKHYWLPRLFNPTEFAVIDKGMIDEVIYELNHKTISLSELYDWSGWLPSEISFVCFRNGYSKDAPEIWCGCNGIRIGKAKPEWSDNAQGNFFIIELGKILAFPVVLE